MASYKVEICGVNTSTLPILKESEKKDLFVRIKNGDLTARETYIRGNLRLVLSVIRRFSASNENVDDLFQIGCIGRYLRDNSSVRVSRSLRDIAYKAIHARELMIRNNNQEPTLDEIAAEIQIPKEEIAYALDGIQTPVSLYDPIYTDGGEPLYVMDQISDKKNKEDRWVEKLSLSDAMKRLNKRENHIIQLRFFEGKTQMEVADEIHISQAQVSRLEKSALKTMRNYLTVT